MNRHVIDNLFCIQMSILCYRAHGEADSGFAFDSLGERRWSPIQRPRSFFALARFFLFRPPLQTPTFLVSD